MDRAHLIALIVALLSPVLAELGSNMLETLLDHTKVRTLEAGRCMVIVEIVCVEYAAAHSNSNAHQRLLSRF